MSVNASEDTSSTAGVVELREDIPLKPSGQRAGAGIGRYFTGIRFVAGCFAVLTAAISVALATQIYCGDYELVPHGAVATDNATCSRAGADALKAGGGAVDASVAAALCLAVLSPHNTGLDAGGAMMMYDYRGGRAQGPIVADWSGAVKRDNNTSEVVPRLVAGLAWMHGLYGKLPWKQLVEPAAELARYQMSRHAAAEAVAEAAAAAVATQQPDAVFPLKTPVDGEELALHRLATYLLDLANDTDTDLAALTSAVPVSSTRAMRAELGGFVLYTPPAQPAADTLVAALRQVFAYDYDMGGEQRDIQIISRTASSLQQALRAGAGAAAAGAGAGVIATNIAVIDKDDVYVSLVTGMSNAFGSRTLAPGGFLLDGAAVPALTPIIITENYTCGRRFVLGSNDVSALAQVTASLVATEHNLTTSVEQPRFRILPDSTIGIEVIDNTRSLPQAALQYLETVGKLHNSKEPYYSVNVVQQLGDALSSHSDSRGGGISYRF